MKKVEGWVNDEEDEEMKKVEGWMNDEEDGEMKVEGWMNDEEDGEMKKVEGWVSKETWMREYTSLNMAGSTCFFSVSCVPVNLFHSSTHSFTHSSTHSSTHSFVPSLTHSSTHSFVPSLTHSLIHPLIHPPFLPPPPHIDLLLAGPDVPQEHLRAILPLSCTTTTIIIIK